MNASMNRIATTAITLLTLTACSSGSNPDNRFNYEQDGVRATLESITGVWEEIENNSGSSLDLAYVVIREDGTYMRAIYNGEALQDGTVGCYYIWESTIEELSPGEGTFVIGEDTFDVFTYGNSMGYYKVTFDIIVNTIFDSEYERSNNTETEFDFTPICQG